ADCIVAVRLEGREGRLPNRIRLLRPQDLEKRSDAAWLFRLAENLDQLDPFERRRLRIPQEVEPLRDRVGFSLPYAERDRSAAEPFDLREQVVRQPGDGASLERLLERLEQDRAMLLLGSEAEQLDAGSIILLRAGHGEPLHESRQDRLLDDFRSPEGRGAEQVEHLVTLRLASGFDRPPQEQRRVNVVGVLVS